MKARIVIRAIAPLSLLVAAACGVTLRKQTAGAMIGAAAGGAIGGAIGSKNGSTAKGAIIGAAVGGIAGGIIGRQMDKQAAELAQNIPGATVERVGEGIQVTFASGLLYDFDSDNVRSDAAANLRNFVASLDQYPNTDILIVGHTDAVGSDGYNYDLSERRSEAAAQFLVARGVEQRRVRTAGRGESEPVASNDTETGRQQNRRVEVAIYANEAYRSDLVRRYGGIE